jgi:outer membrane immunogenic protein
MSKSLIVAAGILATGIVSAAAADMRMPVKAPPIVDPPISWSGFYLGGDLGGSWGRGSSAQTDTTTTTTTTTTVTQAFRDSLPPALTNVPGVNTTFPTTTTTGPTTAAVAAFTSGRANVNGFMGGGQAGYRQQFSMWVLGIEGDIEGSTERGSFTVCSAAGCPIGSAIGTANFRLRWLSTLRGTIGFLVHPKILLYGTGGLAIGGIGVDYLSGINGGALTASGFNTTRAGLAVGAGVEGKIDQHWSVRGQYLFVDLGSFSNSLGAGAATTTTTTTVGPFVQIPGAPNGFTSQATTTTTTTSSTAAQVHSRLRDHVFKIAFNYQF